MTENKKPALTPRQEAIINRLNHSVYTAKYISEWLGREDNIAVNAPAALIEAGVHAYYEAVVQLERSQLIDGV